MKEIIEHFGGKARLAEALGVERSAVSLWLRHGLPPYRAIEIETLSDGKFKAADIVGIKGESNDGDN